MQITFIAPSLNLCGGTRVISIYAELLGKRGHKVIVISPGEKVSTYFQKIKSFIKGNGWKQPRVFYTDYFSESKIDLRILDSCRPVTDDDVPDADVVIATFWTTAEWVSRFSESKGKKVYFIQGHEVFPGFPIERVKATLRLPFKKIVISKWLVDVMKEQYGDTNVALVPNGVNLSQFSAAEREKNETPTVGIVYVDASIKGCDLAFKSIETARKVIPDLKIVAFGRDIPTRNLPLPKNTEYIFKPEQNEIRNIYAKCDAWIFSSRSDGFGLPILEAMACRTPVIGTTAGAAPELITGGAGILVDVDDSDMLTESIIKICQMTKTEWKDMSDRAFRVALQHTWENSVILFEKTLDSILD